VEFKQATCVRAFYQRQQGRTAIDSRYEFRGRALAVGWGATIVVSEGDVVSAGDIIAKIP